MRISANFTNATEILSVGYPQWGDAQVGEGLVAATPEAQTTLVTATDMPSWRRVVMAVSAFFGSHGTQTSTLNCTIGMNETPQARVSLSIPHVMFNNDDDDNDDGTNDCDQVMFDIPENDIAKGYVTFASDEYTNGTIRVEISLFHGDVYTNNEASAIAPNAFEVAVDGEKSISIPLYFNPWSCSLYQYPSVTALAALYRVERRCRRLPAQEHAVPNMEMMATTSLGLHSLKNRIWFVYIYRNKKHAFSQEWRVA